MTSQLTRVQVYLDPIDLYFIDDLAKKVKVTRSQIIRDATMSTACRYIRLAEFLEKKSPKRNPLIDLIGIGKSKTGTIGLNVDEIYLND
ncbi:MAG: CopG family transcriptional regulator [Patescibacteria group bacterium]